MSDSPIVHAVGDGRHRRDGRVGRAAVAVDDLAEDHLVQPALLSVRTQDEPVGAVLLEQLDLVTLVEVADLRAAELVRRVEQTDDPVADDPPLAPGERADEALVEGEPQRGRGVADRVGLAGLEEGRSPPAREQRFVDARIDRHRCPRIGARREPRRRPKPAPAIGIAEPTS